MLIDTHAHVNFETFNRDYDEVIKRSLGENVWMINVGSKYEISKRAMEIASRYDKGVYAVIGLHPIHVLDEEFEIEKYKKLVRNKSEGAEKVVAVGETGLDYFKDYGKFKDKQKEVLLKHLDLAKELNLPLILHCRKAHEDILDILNSQFIIHNSNFPGVIHCFTGTWEEAEKYLEMGFYLGINGIMYKFDLKEVIEKAPLNRLLLETDCPYLGKEERNEPTFVRQIAKDIARIKNIPFEEVSQTTTQNAQKLFSI